MLMRLESNWYQLFLPLQAEPSIIKTIFSQVVTVCSCQNRFYHNLSHIQQVLHVLNTLKSLADNLPAIQMAAWFHDVIYDSKSHKNEEKSAEFAITALINLKVPLPTINQVVRLILDTQKHSASLDEIDSQIFLDVDLSILGAAASEYGVYAQAIRQEYSWLADEDYKMGRKKVLENFLQRETIYFTKMAGQMFELQARENIRNEILELSR
jgi:predicted metal-dependent HD superfamily phosphohydrolase